MRNLEQGGRSPFHLRVIRFAPYSAQTELIDISTSSPNSIQNIIKMLAGNAQVLRNFNLWHFKVIKNIDENSTRMRWAAVGIANAAPTH